LAGGREGKGGGSLGKGEGGGRRAYFSTGGNRGEKGVGQEGKGGKRRWKFSGPTLLFSVTSRYDGHKKGEEGKERDGRKSPITNRVLAPLLVRVEKKKKMKKKVREKENKRWTKELFISES